MSKQRARRREARLVQAQAAAERAERLSDRESRRRERRHTRQRWWRQVRLWHNGPHAARHRERWAALVVGVLVLLLLTYLFTSSWAAVGLMVLVTVVATPALISLVSDRSSP